MKTTLRILALSVVVATLSLTTVSPLIAAQHKEPVPGSGTVDVPNLDRDPGLYFLFSEQAEAQGDPDEVIRYLRKALHLDPTSAYLNIRVASMLARSRKLADALIMAQNATLFDPQYRGSLYPSWERSIPSPVIEPGPSRPIVRPLSSNLTRQTCTCSSVRSKPRRNSMPMRRKTFLKMIQVAS